MDHHSEAGSGRSESQLLQLVTFNLAQEEFGVDILRVQEIIRMLPITKVPNSPPFVEGVINLRGKVIPVIDMRKRFSLTQNAHDARTRIMVMELLGQVVGFVVDGVSEVLRIPASTVEEPPAVVAGVGSEYIKGVGKLNDRLLILLDLDKLLDAEEHQSLAGI